MLTVREFSERYRITQEQTLRLIKTGLLDAVNLSLAGAKRPTWRISPDAIERFELRRSTTPPPAETPRRRKPAAPVKSYF